jgi:hypothetical protein
MTPDDGCGHSGQWRTASTTHSQVRGDVMHASHAVTSDGLDVRHVAREIQREFAVLACWYGNATGSWWAVVATRRGARLIEAAHPQQLREVIADARGQAWRR